MVRNSIASAVLVCLSSIILRAESRPEGLRLTLLVTKSETCLQRDALTVLRLSVKFEVSNGGSKHLIVPKLTRITGLKVLRLGKLVYEQENDLSDLDAISKSLWEKTPPDPDAFDILARGQRTQRGPHIIIIPLARANARSPYWFTSGRFDLRIKLNFGPAKLSKVGPVVDRWKAIGSLVIGDIDLEDSNVQFGSDKQAGICSGPPTLLRRAR